MALVAELVLWIVAPSVVLLVVLLMLVVRRVECLVLVVVIHCPIRVRRRLLNWHVLFVPMLWLGLTAMGLVLLRLVRGRRVGAALVGVLLGGARVFGGVLLCAHFHLPTAIATKSIVLLLRGWGLSRLFGQSHRLCHRGLASCRWSEGLPRLADLQWLLGGSCTVLLCGIGLWRGIIHCLFICCCLLAGRSR